MLNIRVGLPDKFALKAFNRLAYDREISGPLVASTLLGLPDHYTRPCNVKTINIKLLRDRFPDFAIRSYNHTSNVDDFVRLRQQVKTPSTMFENYTARGNRFHNFCLYVYLRVVDVFPRKLAQKGDIDFSHSHRNQHNLVQRHGTRDSPSVIKLLGQLCDTEDIDDTILIDHANEDGKLNNIAVILLALFVPWERLPILFRDAGATENTYISCCWNIWSQCCPTLDAHVQYYASNLLQMRRSKVEAQAQAAANAEANHSTVTTEEIMEENQPATLDEANDFLNTMEFRNDECIESIITATLYKWRSNDINDSLAFPAVAHMWNAIRTDADNDFSSMMQPTNPIHNSIYSSMGVMNRVGDDMTTLWQTITKSAAAAVSDNLHQDNNNDVDYIPTPTAAIGNNDGMFVPTSDVVNLPPCNHDLFNQIKGNLGM